MSYVESFDAGFQRAVLRLMMVDEQFCAAALRWLDAGFFTVEALGWIYGVLQRYWTDYHRMCPDTPLRGALRYAPPSKVAYYHQEVEQVIARGFVAEADWVRAQLVEFCRQSEFTVAHREAATLFNAGKQTEAYDVMAKAQDRMREIAFATIDRQWFFEELHERQSRRGFDDSEGFTTGVRDLDWLTGGGVQPGEVWAVLAYAKRGKTTWLVNQGFNALRVHNAPVLHVILEGNSQKIAARYDALFSGALYSSVKSGGLTPEETGRLYEEYSRMRRLLVIRALLEDWDTNITHLHTEVKELRAHGFRPKMMCLDYVDLLRARYKADSETHHQVESSRDLKRFAEQEALRVWTGWQAQRPRANAHLDKEILTSASVADAYAKVRIVDAYGSLNATDEEMRNNQMRLFWEAHRESEVRKAWLITNDLAHSRMIDYVSEIPQEAPPTKP